MRLINIDELKGCAIIRPHSRADMKAIESCSEVVLYDDIPTAYDIDKVIEQLKEEIKQCETGAFDDGYEQGIYDAYNDAIEIVKGGAK